MTEAAVHVHVTGIGLWTKHYASASAFRNDDRAPGELKPIGLAFDKRGRRRVSSLGRAIGDAVEEAVTAAGVDPVTTPVIVGSAVGEASTMIGLLDSMWRTREPMSPAAFTVSVHNAASGMISIAKKNVGFTTSLAADRDTPFAALLEGAALVATTGGPVVVVCADEASPRSLMSKDDPNWDMLAAALVLAPAGESGLARLQLVSDGEAAPASLEPAGEDALAGNPTVGMFDLVAAIAREERGVVALDRGHGRGYCAEIRDPEGGQQ